MNTVHIVAHEQFLITVLEESGTLKTRLQRRDGGLFVLDGKPPVEYVVYGDFDTIDSGVRFVKGIADRSAVRSESATRRPD